MFDRLFLPVAVVLSLFVTWWIGSGIYRYFNYQTPPAIELKIIVPNGSYTRVAQGLVCANNPYKISTITATLDGKELFTHSIGAKQFEHPYTIDTTTLADGPHALEIKAVDSSYHGNITIKPLTINVDNAPYAPHLLTLNTSSIKVKHYSSKFSPIKNWHRRRLSSCQLPMNSIKKLKAQPPTNALYQSPLKSAHKNACLPPPFKIWSATN